MKYNKLLLASTALTLFISLYDCTSIKPTQKIAPSFIDGAITLPSGWDDSIIDKIKGGETTKIVLAVLDFEGNDKLEDKVDLKMSDMLITALVKTGRYEIVERNKIEKVLSEQRLQLSGIVDETSAAEFGKLLGAEYIVFGSITSATRKDIDKFGYILVQIEVSIDVRAVNTTTGKILLSESADGLCENKIVRTADGIIVSGAIDYNSAYVKASRDAVDKVAIKIAKLSPIIGFVISTSNAEVTIDVGEDRGVKKDYLFVVFRIGEEIIHPVTGKRIGWAKEILCEINIYSTEKSMSTGNILIKNTDKIIQPGDLVISK